MFAIIEAEEIKTLFANPQPAIDGVVEIADDDPKVAAFFFNMAKADYLNQFGSVQAAVLSKFVEVTTLGDPDAETLSAMKAARTAMINIANADSVSSAVDPESLKSALVAEYQRIVVSVPKDLASVFPELNL